MKHASVTNAYAAIAVMKLTQVLSQAHATAGYNRNKFLVFALLCTNCFTLVTLYGTVPRFSGTLDIDDAADVDLRSSSGGEGRGGESAWGEEGGGALGTGQGGTSALRLSNATDRSFKRGFGMQVSVLRPGMGPGKGGRREGGQLGWGRLKSRGQGKTPALRLSNATDRTLKRGFGMQASIAYRLSASLFVVIGLSPLPLHRNLDARVCRWYPATSSSSPILGEVSIEYPGESHSKPYEVAMLFCQLSSPTPSTRERGRKGDGRRSAGGHLTVVIEREEILVLGEPANEKLPLPLEPSAPYASNITYCSSPIYGQFNSLRVLEWVVYHQQGHGVDLFHMYNAGGMGEPIMRTLGPFIKEGQMTVTDVTEVDEFETWFGQVLVVNDCAYRSLFTSRWVLFLDLDEYLYVSQPLGSSLITALAHYESYSRWVLFLDLDEYLYFSQPLRSSLITALARYEVSVLPINSLARSSPPDGCSSWAWTSTSMSHSPSALPSSPHSLAMSALFQEKSALPESSAAAPRLLSCAASLLLPISHFLPPSHTQQAAYVSFGSLYFYTDKCSHSLNEAAYVSFGSLYFYTDKCSHSMNVAGTGVTKATHTSFAPFPSPVPLFPTQQAAYVSFGSLYFYTDKCSHSMNVSASSPPRWEVERMIFRQADVHCVAPKRYESRDMCLGFDGHRKYVADPRKVKLFGVSGKGQGNLWNICLSGR
ncbi:unnamed protein product [Closterium sp. Naga37s-1]|nr:unnamed protein product [Closterium sp. Naga37s-1]